MRGGDQGLRSDDEQKRVCENTDRGGAEDYCAQMSVASAVLGNVHLFFFFL